MELYSVKDIQKITGRNYQWCYQLIKKLQKKLYRENPDYDYEASVTIPKWFFEKVMLGK